MFNSKLLAFTVTLLLLCGGARAQLLTTGAGGTPVAGVVYLGPGDVVTSGWTLWTGLRAFNTAQALAHTRAVSIYRRSDATSCDFNVTSAGALGGSAAGCAAGTGLTPTAFATVDATCTGTIASTTLTCTGASSTPNLLSVVTGVGVNVPTEITACGTFTGGAGTCTLSKASSIGLPVTITMLRGMQLTALYDQSGNTNNITAASGTGNAPSFLPDCGGGLPCLSTVAGGINMGTSPGVLGSQPLSISAVTERIGNLTSYSVIASPNNANPQEVGFSQTAGKGYMLGTSIIDFTMTSGALHALNVTFTGGVGAANVDGTDNTGLATGSATGSTTVFQSFARGGGTNPLKGYISELGYLYGVALTPTQRGNLCHNQFGYWATAVSC